MTIIIRHPPNYATERRYTFDVMCGEFLGLPFETIAEERDDISISFANGDAELRVADVFFRTGERDWLRAKSLPALPLDSWQFPEALADATGSESLPVLFGKAAESGDYIASRGGNIELGLDVFGSAFFMLTRYEEACSDVVDEFGRFPAGESLAARAGFLERPIVNEYLEILWACLHKLQPGLVRKAREYTLVLSHDVDRLFDTRDQPWITVARNAIGDIAKRRDVALAAKRLYSKTSSRAGDYSHEPCNTFDFIMDCSERHGIKSAFYFLAHQGDEGLDGDYVIEMPWVRSLLRRIHERGHELGLHASYGSFDDPAQIAAEFTTLRNIAEAEGVQQSGWGGRQHYLRWVAATTWQAWEDAGLAYDATLTYAEVAGFRSGTCFDYPAFNLNSREGMRLRERPLVTMETTLFSDDYMNLSDEKALQAIVSLAATCRRFDGTFTLLWHNDNLARGRQKKLYREVLQAVS
jgi:peptidoglycan/xylan/chitin deacetylase (PgdA/CDA1 family)